MEPQKAKEIEEYRRLQQQVQRIPPKDTRTPEDHEAERKQREKQERKK